MKVSTEKEYAANIYQAQKVWCQLSRVPGEGILLFPSPLPLSLQPWLGQGVGGGVG